MSPTETKLQICWTVAWSVIEDQLNPVHANVPFLYLLKTSENLWFFGVFRGYRNGTLLGNGLKSVTVTNAKPS